MNPLVSVIIPTRNGKNTLIWAVGSVLSQTYSNLEIIIIDDNSDEETKKVIGEIARKDSRVRILNNEKQLGFVKTLNRGIKDSNGKYIARIDDDDCWIDNKKIEKQVYFLETNKEYVLVGGGVIRVKSNGEEVVRYLLPKSDSDIRKNILINNAFAHSAVVFSRDAFSRVAGYNEEFGFFADRDLWLKLGEVGKFYNFPEYFISYLDKEIEGNYKSRDVLIRRKLIQNLKLRLRYRKEYGGFMKSIVLVFFSYFYSFVPYKNSVWPIIYKIRTVIFGEPSYKYENKNAEK